MNMTITELKAKCRNLIDQVATARQPLMITKRGVPVAHVVPVESDDERSSFGYMKGAV